MRRFDPVAGDPARLAAGVTGLVGQGYSVTLCAATASGAVRLSSALAAEGVHAPVLEAAPGTAGACVVAAPLTSGFILPDAKVAVLSETDVTGRRVPHRRARPRSRAADGFFDDLEAGSFVVHRQHGVARFEGVTTRTMGGTTRDYLILQYRGSDRLYLPVEQIEAITPYSGGESPTLSKMGGADWQRTRAKARAAASEVAAELVELYRRRLAVEGRAFGPDTPWQTEMESSFEFVETEDQLKAIADVKADMEEPRPMDRLVCGDVGFGKTEVAIRAAFKAVQDGTQAAVWRRRRCWPASTRRPSPIASPPIRCGWSCSAASCRRPSNASWCRDWPTAASTSSSAPTACWPRTCSSRSSASSSSTRSSASGSRTRR